MKYLGRILSAPILHTIHQGTRPHSQRDLVSLLKRLREDTGPGHCGKYIHEHAWLQIGQIRKTVFTRIPIFISPGAPVSSPTPGLTAASAASEAVFNHATPTVRFQNTFTRAHTRPQGRIGRGVCGHVCCACATEHEVSFF